MDEVCSQPRFLFKTEVDEDFTDNLVIDLHLSKKHKAPKYFRIPFKSFKLITNNFVRVDDMSRKSLYWMQKYMKYKAWK